MPPKIQLPNPFRTYAAHIYPRTIKDALTWGEYLWERNATYRNCIKKVVSYFASGISVRQDDTDDETDSEASAAFHDLVTDTYGMLPLVQRFGEELAAMGNVFVYVQRVCTRDLLCPTEGCGTVLRMRSLVRDRDYRWDPPSVGDDSGGWMRGVRMRCPRCGQDVRMTMRDSKSQDDRGRRLRIVFLPAADMRVRHNRLTDTYSYVYRMPQDVSDAIRRGEQIYLEDTPEVFLEAALRGEPYVILPQDALLAMRVPSLSGLDRVYGGWGLPMFMSAFDDIVRMQHMDKFNEAVMNDYLVPHRIISPAPQNLKAGIDDPNRMPMSGSMFRDMMASSIQGRSVNPSQWTISPVPVQYQQVGGDKSIIPADLLEWEAAQMFVAMGAPQEFRKTDLQTVAPTMGLRMFERQWRPFSRCLDLCVRWISRHIAYEHRFEGLHCELDETSFVEDDMNRQVLLSLMQAGMVAKAPVLKTFGIDFEDDLEQRQREAQMEQDAALRAQTQQQGMEAVMSVIPPPMNAGVTAAQANLQAMQQAMGGGGAPAAMGGAPGAPAPMGGAPAMGGGGAEGQPADVQQVWQQAQDIAQQLYAAPPNVRERELRNLKATNPMLHSGVMQILRDMRQSVASDAVAQSQQPQM